MTYSSASSPTALRVLVIDESQRRGSDLCAGLALAGCQVAAVLAEAGDLPRQVEAVKPDVILIGTDNPSRDTLEHLAAMNRDMPRPVVIFADEGDQVCIRNAMKAGVAAYVVDGLEPARVKPVIDVALARFEADQALKRELETTQKKLSERRLVEQAKGLLMKLKGLDEDEAYKLLRKLAMDRGQPIGTVAQNVLETARLLL
jgi:response regulator NasT